MLYAVNILNIEFKGYLHSSPCFSISNIGE